MTIRAVEFAIGHDRYLVDAGIVREVVADPRPTRLPTAPTVFQGVFNLRGEIVPLFDTAALLGFPRPAYASLAIVVSLPAGPAGLMVSALPTMENLGDAIGPSELRGTAGTFDVAGGVAVMLDVEALLMPHTNLAGAGAAVGAGVGAAAGLGEHGGTGRP